MSLLQQLTSDMVSAMKNRDKETLNVVRMLKAAVQNEQIELGHDLSANEEIAVMAREYKQRKESLEEFEKAGREDESWELNRRKYICNACLEKISLIMSK